MRMNEEEMQMARKRAWFYVDARFFRRIDYYYVDETKKKIALVATPNIFYYLLYPLELIASKIENFRPVNSSDFRVEWQVTDGETVQHFVKKLEEILHPSEKKEEFNF